MIELIFCWVVGVVLFVEVFVVVVVIVVVVGGSEGCVLMFLVLVSLGVSMFVFM